MAAVNGRKTIPKMGTRLRETGVFEVYTEEGSKYIHLMRASLENA